MSPIPFWSKMHCTTWHKLFLGDINVTGGISCRNDVERWHFFLGVILILKCNSEHFHKGPQLTLTCIIKVCHSSGFLFSFWFLFCKHIGTISIPINHRSIYSCCDGVKSEFWKRSSPTLISWSRAHFSGFRRVILHGKE